MNDTFCRICGDKNVDLRCGVCYPCATAAEAKGCAERGYHEYDDRPGKPFYDRCESGATCLAA